MFKVWPINGDGRKLATPLYTYYIYIQPIMLAQKVNDCDVWRP